MTYRGRIRNGVAVIDSPVPLPDGTEVRIEVEPNGAEFWAGKSIADLAREQNVAVTHQPDDLAGDWPAGDSVEEFLAFLREARR